MTALADLISESLLLLLVSLGNGAETLLLHPFYKICLSLFLCFTM